MTMQLSTIDMPRDEAREALDHYRAAIKADRRDEDRRIAAGLRAIIAGHPLIKLPQTIAAGGWFDNGLPRLAVCPAQATRCFVRRSYRFTNSQEYIYSDQEGADNRGALVGEHTVRVRVPTERTHLLSWSGATVVPLVPPQHRRSNGRGGMAGLHLLWQVEAWDLTPPVDPALIKWVGGDLWAVLAMWDLTELERAVLSGRS